MNDVLEATAKTVCLSRELQRLPQKITAIVGDIREAFDGGSDICVDILNHCVGIHDEVTVVQG